MAVITPIYLQVLVVLHTRLKDTPICWAITGSMGMVLQGMDLEIHDIDLQCDREGAYAIQNLFPEYMTERVQLLEREYTRSHFGRMQIMNLQVEVMGDMAHRDAGTGWNDPPDLSCLIRRVDFVGMDLPVMDLEHEYVAYQQLGRPEKAAKIRAFLDRGKGDQ